MLNMVNGSLDSELSRFFQIIQDDPMGLTGVTPAAFSKARKKFSYTAFKSLNKSLITDFYASDKVERWNGFRLLAVDGSVTSLPMNKELLDYYGKARSFSSYPSARLSQLYDICNKLSVDIQVAPHSSGERSIAQRHLDCAGPDDLILYDRGYPAGDEENAGGYVYRVAENAWHRLDLSPPPDREMKEMVGQNRAMTYDPERDLVLMVLGKQSGGNLGQAAVYALNLQAG